MTLFPGFEEQIGLSKEVIETYEEKLIQFLKSYFSIVNIFCTEIFLPTLRENYNSEWMDDVETIFNSQHNYEEVVIKTDCSLVSNEELRRFIESAHELILPRERTAQCFDASKYSSLIRSVGPEKAEQVLNFYEFLSEHYELQKYKIFDFGAGKGYLSAFLALEKGLSVVAIEGSLEHSAGLAERLKQTLKLYNECNGERSIDNANLLSISETFITKDTDLTEVEINAIPALEFVKKAKFLDEAREHEQGFYIQGKCASTMDFSSQEKHEYKSNILVVGLHACGDLSEIALSLPNVKVAVVPCCYPHITSANFPVSELGKNVYSVLASLSSERHNNISVPRYFFSNACVNFEDELSVLDAAAVQFYERAVIEKFRYMEGEFEKTCFKRKFPLEDELINMGFEKTTVLRELPPLQDNLWKFKLNIIIRQVFGEVFESFILVDRMLQKSGFSIDYILGGISGRAFCIFSD